MKNGLFKVRERDCGIFNNAPVYTVYDVLMVNYSLKSERVAFFLIFKDGEFQYYPSFLFVPVEE